MLKICSKCKIAKPLDEFYVNNKSKDGKQHRCKECSKEFTQPATKAWRVESKETYKESTRGTKLRVKYGLTPSQLYEMLDQQEGCCLICGMSISFDSPDKRNTPHVDHNHVTGNVRGLLCLTCNTGLGMFGDNPNLLIKAAAYLWRERTSEKTLKDDAMFHSYENNNCKKSAEMTDSRETE